MSDEQRAALAEALAFVRERRVVRRRERVLVACGGGAASVGMMAFFRLAFDSLALRSVTVLCVDDGTEDVAERCADAARAARVLKFDVHIVERDSLSVLARARRAQRDGRFTALALGHTIEDGAARVLREIVEGTAVRGLAARRRDGVARPLLGSTIRSADLLSALAGVEVPTAADRGDPRGSAAIDRAFREGILRRVRAAWPDADRALSKLPRQVRAQRLRSR